MVLVSIKCLISESYDFFLVTDVIDVCQKALYILVDMARDRWICQMIEVYRGFLPALQRAILLFCVQKTI